MKHNRNKEKPAPDMMPPPVNELAVPRWGNAKVWLNLAFLFLTLGIAVFSIEQAHWITPQPYFTLLLFFSVAVVWLLTVARLPGWALHLIAMAAGVLIVFWQGAMILPAGGGIGRLISLFSAWWQGGAGLHEGDGQAIFGILLALLTWLTGYLAAWFVLRRKNAWVAVLLGLIIIMVNLSNLPGKNFIFFTFFLLAAVLLIIQTNIVRQSSSGHKASYSGKSMFYLVVSLFCITMLAVSISWVTPQLRLSSLQNAIAAGMPWKSGVEQSGFNILNAVPSKKSVSTAARIQDLHFGTSWNLGDDIIYAVKSPQPAYWQVNVYDNYTSESWVSTAAVDQLLEKKNGWDDTSDIPGRTRVSYVVTPEINTDIMLLTGNFVSADIPALARLGVDNEITGARSPRVLTPGEKYTVRVYVADNSAAVLSAAPVDYPASINATYLQLPEAFPEIVRELSDNLTREAKTPYEKVMAIHDYLVTFPYSRDVAPLPVGADAVEDFLFTQKKGFCLHFASAMTVMLRAEGVPARLAVGYLPGDPSDQKGIYLLRDKHYHAWTQVYFPGYGWIDFEATPPGNSDGQVPLNSPLVSVNDLKNLPNWDFWYFPPGSPNKSSPNVPAPVPQAGHIFDPRFGFSDQLGLAVVIIMCLAGAFGLLFALTRIIRPFYSNRLWDVDRDNLATSAYANLYRLAEMNNLVPVAQQTPLEFSSKIAEIIPEQSRDLQFLTRAYLDKRFGPDKGNPGLYEEAEILKARVLVYNAILRKRGRIHKFLWKS